MGGLSERPGRGEGVAVMRLSELMEVVRRGERQRWTGSVSRAGESDGGSGSWACLKNDPRQVSLLSEVSLSWCGIWPPMRVARLPAAAMMASSGVTDGLEMYLCLWKTVAETRVRRVPFIQMIHAR